MLNFRATLTCPVLALVTCAIAPAGAAQNPPRDPNRIELPAGADADWRFDVASVRPAPPGEPGRGFGFNPQTGRLRARNQTLRTLISIAYGRFPLPLPEDRMSGGPSWLDEDRFTIEATAPVAALQGDVIRQVGLMLRALLEERFKLAVRVETSERRVFALVLARQDGRIGPAMHPGERCGEGGPQGVGGGPGASRLSCTSMAELAFTLAELAGAPVIDRTGLTARYDGTLEWSPAPGELAAFGAPTGLGAGAPASEAPEAGISLFTALEEQLGLKLEAQRAPVDVLVIESAERPEPN